MLKCHGALSYSQFVNEAAAKGVWGFHSSVGAFITFKKSLMWFFRENDFSFLFSARLIRFPLDAYLIFASPDGSTTLCLQHLPFPPEAAQLVNEFVSFTSSL